MTRRAKGGTTKTKHKQLAQLAGRQNIKLELKMGNYANWFITLATGNVEGENNNKSREGNRKTNLKCQIVRILIVTKKELQIALVSHASTVEPKGWPVLLRANIPCSDVAS